MPCNKTHCRASPIKPALTDPPNLHDHVTMSSDEQARTYELHTERLLAVNTVWRDTVTLPAVAALSLLTVIVLRCVGA